MRTIFYKNKPSIIGVSSIGGPKESAGGIGEYLEIKGNDDTFGESTFEKAEKQMLFTVIEKSIVKAHKTIDDIDAIIAGDLLDQIISATFSARNFDSGYLGVYNACATFTEALTVGATFIDGDYLRNVICGTSSHFASAERQYRYPLELGCTRPPQSQWTVTGAGACVLGFGSEVKITCSTIGRVIDFGVVDVNNMGAAMAPAAADTLYTHFIETRRSPDYYDLIISGDLGILGSKILTDLIWQKGYDISNNYIDCGAMVYKTEEKEYQGGSGAGCSSMVFCSYFYKQLIEKKLNRVLLMSTGALLSSLSSQQGESIPGIAHGVCIERQE